MKKRISKGFTLIELLVVIVIIGIVFFVGYVAVNKIIESSRKKTFVTYVDSIIDVIKLNNALVDDSYCFYDFAKDNNNNNPNIENIYIIYKKSNSNEQVSVYASYKDKKYVIDLADYSNFVYGDDTTWDLISKDSDVITQINNDQDPEGYSINTETLMAINILNSDDIKSLGKCDMQEVKE